MEKIIIQEVGISIAKGVMGGIPFVGTALNEVIFDGRGRVKQERINSFILELTKYMKEVTENQINYEYIKSDEFGDIFESIMKRVVYNKCTEKMHRFKTILVGNMINPSYTDYSETFLDIVAKINEKQIEILDIYREVEEDNQISTDKAYRKPEYYNLDKSTYNFYVQDLISKSLLVDDGMGRIGTGSLQILKITQFGIEFLKFIKSN